jgi:putative acetyltransferase
MNGGSGSPTPFHIRHAGPDDRDRLVDIWWRSACATHRFLPAQQLEALLPEVRALQLETLNTWVLCVPTTEAVGFLVMDGRSVEALFIAPEWLRRGGGARLMRHARQIAGPLTVEVNEQNADAVEFYRAQGFEIARRAPVDRAGRPYPLLYLEESHAAAVHRREQARK